MELNISEVKDFVVLMDKEEEKPLDMLMNLQGLKREIRSFEKSEGIMKELSFSGIEYYFRMLRNCFQ